MLRQSEILILNEATGNVDVEMISGYRKLLGRSSETTLVETIPDSEAVAVLEKGNLVEFGPRGSCQADLFCLKS
jgi:ABC-type multidrug transport system fused ATPase/permease subunit